MVHALTETWRVLHTTGILVDLRPRHSNQAIEQITNGQPEMVTCYNDDHRLRNDVAADNAIATAVDSQLFQLVKSVTFTYVRHYDTGTELMDYFLTRNPPVYQPERIIKKIYRADMDTNTTLRLTHEMQLNGYRKIAK